MARARKGGDDAVAALMVAIFVAVAAASVAVVVFVARLVWKLILALADRYARRPAVSAPPATPTSGALPAAAGVPESPPVPTPRTTSGPTHWDSPLYGAFIQSGARIERAVAHGDFDSAARSTREALRELEACLDADRAKPGFVLPPSIVALERGATVLALVGDDAGLAEIERIVTAAPELADRVPALDRCREERRLFQEIARLVAENPGCMQTHMKRLLGVTDGRRVGALIHWLEKAGRIERTRSGKTYALSLAPSSVMSELRSARGVARTEGATFTALDVETANSSRASICQIGVVHFIDGEAVDRWDQLVDPEEEFSAFNVSVHGIRREHVTGAPTFRDVFTELRRRTADGIVVSHTAFDRGALEQAAAKYSLPRPRCRWLDSAQVARHAWPDKYGRSGYGLRNLASDLGISYRSHNAAEDAWAAGQVILLAVAATGRPLEEWLEAALEPVYASAGDWRPATA